MARIRTIKPEFWRDEKLGCISRDARLLFIGIWNYADDFGRIVAGPRVLRGMLFPFDDDVDVPGLLEQLIGAGCLRRYEVEGHQYLSVVNWFKHQRIDKRLKSQLPAPPDESFLEIPKQDACFTQPIAEIHASHFGISDKKAKVPKQDAENTQPVGVGSQSQSQSHIKELPETLSAQQPPTPPKQKPKKNNDTTPSAIKDMLAADFREAVGSNWDPKVQDWVALAELRKRHPDAEIRDRWRKALRIEDYPLVASLSQLRSKWDDIAKKTVSGKNHELRLDPPCVLISEN